MGINNFLVNEFNYDNLPYHLQETLVEIQQNCVGLNYEDTQMAILANEPWSEAIQACFDENFAAHVRRPRQRQHNQFQRTEPQQRHRLQNSAHQWALKARKIALKVLNYVGLIIANVLTFGTLSLVCSILKYKKIKKLEAQLPSNKPSRVPGDTLPYRWVEPIYQKGAHDKDSIEGEFRNLTQARVPASKVAEILHGKGTIEALIEETFDWAAENLGINETVNTAHKEALHHWMIYLLVQNAGLGVACDQVTRSVVFNESLSCGPSEACHVFGDDGKIKHTFYRNIDEWTPKADSQVIEGVDPVSLKWVLEKIKGNPVALGHLRALLLQVIHPANDLNVEAAHRFISNKTEASRLVHTAYILIHNLSKVMEENFSKPLQSKWDACSANIAVQAEIHPTKGVPKPDWVADATSPINRTSLHKKVHKLALTILAIIGIAIVNVLTLGFLTAGSYVYQVSRQKKLEKQIRRLGPLVAEPNNTASDVWVKPLYNKTDQDPSSIQIQDVNMAAMLQGDYKELNNMSDLLERTFSHGFNDLIKKSNRGVYGIRFNKSKKIYKEYVQQQGINVLKHQANQQALYGWMVYQLLSNAGLDTDGGTPRVRFSDHLAVRYSAPCDLRTKDGRSTETFFLHEDEWTPERDRELRRGVDPVSVKWILHKFRDNVEARQVLEILILGALVPDDNVALNNVRAYFTANPKEAELIKTAYKLIADMALSVGTKFQVEFYEKWKELATDDEVDPFLKDNALNVDTMEPLWVSHPVLQQENHVNFQEEVLKTKTLLEPVYKNIHDLRDPRNNVYTPKELSSDIFLAVNFLSKQYYCLHAGSFGYEKEHYDLSMKIGNLHLFPYIQNCSNDTIIVANGMSCRTQIADGTHRKAIHIAELINKHLS